MCFFFTWLYCERLTSQIKYNVSNAYMIVSKSILDSLMNFYARTRERARAHACIRLSLRLFTWRDLSVAYSCVESCLDCQYFVDHVTIDIAFIIEHRRLTYQSQECQ